MRYHVTNKLDIATHWMPIEKIMNVTIGEIYTIDHRQDDYYIADDDGLETEIIQDGLYLIRDKLI